MAVVTINPLEDNRWLNFISANKNANIFHHPFWLKVLKSQYKYNVFAVCHINNNNEITSGIPFCEVSAAGFRKKWVSVPFSDYSLPLYCTEEQLIEITEYIVSLYKNTKLGAIEVYWGLDAPNAFLKNSSFVYHVTELVNDEKVLLKSFDRAKGQGIAKSLKQGLTAEFSTSSGAIEKFYELHLKTRKKLGVPIQPKSFFINLHNEIISKGLGFLVLVSLEKLTLAAGLFMGFNETLTYKYNASDPAYLQYRPNNLIIWEAMKEGAKRGYKYFDFGKSDIANEGLRKFKDGWAAVEKPLYYSYFPSAPVAGSYFSIMKDRVIAPVIKTCPDFVCRFIGEVAYKYFPSV